MVIYIVIACLLVMLLCVRLPRLKIFLMHPLYDYYYSIKDAVTHFQYKHYNICPTGEMVCFSGLFGQGKTLSAVHSVVTMYKRYDGRLVYDRRFHRWAVQRVYTLSNVKLNIIPFVPLRSLAEIVSEAEASRAYDKEYGTYTIINVLIDEASVQLNSRSFRANIDPGFLNTMLTCRHYNINFFYTSQRFGLTDKLLRDVTQTVIECRKLWRLQGQYIYDAWTLENSAQPDKVKPLRRWGFFVRDVDYNSYDTLAVVDTLAKSCKEGDMLAGDEILARRARAGVVVDTSTDKAARGLFRHRKSS